MVSKTPTEIGTELREWLQERRMTEEELANAIAAENGRIISQSWISRICNGNFKRLSGKTAVVLRYANIRVEAKLDRDARGEEIISTAVSEVWDGSVGGAKALARVLRSAAALARGGRGPA